MELQKVLGLLKPKAVSFGFTDEELKSAGEFLAGILPDDATDEVIEERLEQFVPVLKISQSASHRSFERFKTQFVKDNPPKTDQNEPTPPIKEPKEPKEPTDGDKVPAWFEAYQKAQEEKLQKQQEALEAMKGEKLQSELRAKALEGLKDVDHSFYGMLLKGKSFTDETDVESFVNDVKTSYDSFAQKVGIQTLAQMKPPVGGQEGKTEASKAVKDRAAKRVESYAKAPSAISSLED